MPQLQQADIIHFATHGILDDLKVKGMPRAIALAVDKQDNGLLSAQEISGMHLNAELAVLSACDTGSGQISGDGVIGLSRAIIASGIPNAIVTLWKIPDAPTAQLMTEFYRDWTKNHDKAKALRHAMLKTKQLYPDPKNWAAFVLMGGN